MSTPSVANRVYPQGYLALLTQGVTALSACNLALVDSTWEFDNTHSTDAQATAGEITAAGYARVATTLSVTLDTATALPTLRLALTGASFPGFTDTAKALIVLLQDGTPLLALQEPNGTSTMPITLATADPLVVGFPAGGILNIQISAA